MAAQVNGEKRRYPRFEVRRDAFAAVKSGDHTVGRVLDVSEGGLGLTYVDGLGWAEKEGTLDLFAPGGIRYLSDAPVRAVSDFEMPGEVPFSSIVLRRMGVAFGALSDAQQRQLRGFILESRGGGNRNIVTL